MGDDAMVDIVLGMLVCLVQSTDGYFQESVGKKETVSNQNTVCSNA